MVNFPPVDLDLDCSDSVAQASLSLALSPRRREKRTHGSHAHRVTHVTRYPLDSFGLMDQWSPMALLDAFGLFAKFALMHLPSFASNKLAGTVVCCWWP